MAEPSRCNLDGLDIELARRIDAVCRRFEADWRAGARPTIGAYLDDVPEEARPTLHAELEALERELRQSDDIIAPPDGRGAIPGDIPPSTVAEAPTIAPSSVPTSPVAGMAAAPVHDAATIPPRDGATTDFGPSEPAGFEAASAAHVRCFGDYEVIRELARGGMGVVFLARQMSLNRRVALKMILAGQLADGNEVKRFYTEAESAANLDHPGIVPIYEVGQHEGQHYFSMGFIEGRSLAQMVADGPLPPVQAAELMVKVAEAVQYAHDRGVIHRDLKPANVLLDARGQPKVTDFGLAKKLQGDSGLTASGQIMGTPSYMPPEQAAGKHDEVGPLADVYSLGAMLYCLLTGRPPFQAAGAMDTLLQVLEQDPVPPRTLNAQVPRDLETICLKCLEKAPARRYDSAQALADDLQRWLRHEPIRARRISPIERAVRWGVRHPAVAASMAAVLIAIAAVIGLTVRDVRRGRETLATVTQERDLATKSEAAAIEARNEARREAKQNLRRLVRSAVGNGNRLVEDGNPLLALPWYVYALKNEPDGPTAEQRHRVRLASLLGETPRLTRLEVKPVYLPGGALPRAAGPADPIPVPKGQVVTRRIEGPDRKLVLITTAGSSRMPAAAGPGRRLGGAIIWDVAAGKPVFPPLTLSDRVVDGTFLDQGRRFLTVAENGVPGRRSEVPNGSELRLWSSERGEPVGEPIPIPLVNVRVELNAAGDRLLVRGDHGPSGRQTPGVQECQVRDASAPKTVIQPRGEEVWREARFSPDGKLVAAVAALVLPDPMHGAGRTGRRKRTLPLGERFTADGRIVSAWAAPVARLFQTRDGEPLPATLQHDATIDRIAFAPDGKSLITAGGDAVRPWEVPSGRPLAPVVQDQSFLGFSFDGRLMLMKSALGAPRAWRLDASVGRVVPASPPLPAAAWSPAIHPEGRSGAVSPTQLEAEFAEGRHEVVITSRNRLENSIETRAWEIRPPDPSSGAGPLSLGTPMHFVRIELAPDGRSFARVSTLPALTLAPVRGPDGRLRPGSPAARPPRPALELFSVGDGKRLAEGPVTSAPSSQAVFSADARRIVLIRSAEPAGSQGLPSGNNIPGDPKPADDMEVQALEVPSLKPAGPVVRVAGPVGPFAVSPDGRRIAITCVGTIDTVNLQQLDRKTGKRTPLPPRQLPHLDELRVYDLQTGQVAPATFRIPVSGLPQLNPVGGLLYRPDGKRLLVRPSRPYSFTAGKYVLPPFHLLDGESLRVIGGPMEIVRPSGANTQSTESLPGFGAFDRLAAFSPDGRLVAMADGGNLAGVFDAETGRRPHGAAWPSHPGRVLWISFSPDGRRMATTGSEGTARLWDARTGTPIGPPMIHPGVVQAAFNTEGHFLITAGGSGLVRVWDGRSADLLIKGFDLRRGVESLVLGPGPHRVVFGLRDQPAPITWEVPVEERPLEQLEALSLVLSGHVIDSGEGLSPASPEQVEAARASLVRRQRDFFAVSATRPSASPAGP